MEGTRGMNAISNIPLRAFGLALSLLFIAGCPSTPTKSSGPPPPQNLLGSTDELQLVTELSLDLASDYGGEHVLVVLEIDGTLLAGLPGQADQQCADDTGRLQPLQADAAAQVRRLQAAGLKVIALTSRGPDCRTKTFADLKNNGFDFAATAWPPREGWPDPFLPEGSDQPVSYENGVFFADGQNKGLMLKILLDKTANPKPVLIVIADKNRDSLNAVMKEFSWTSTKVHAWRYTRENGEATGP